jgi:hypothetical protein
MAYDFDTARFGARMRKVGIRPRHGVEYGTLPFRRTKLESSRPFPAMARSSSLLFYYWPSARRLGRITPIRYSVHAKHPTQHPATGRKSRHGKSRLLSHGRCHPATPVDPFHMPEVKRLALLSTDTVPLASFLQCHFASRLTCPAIHPGCAFDISYSQFLL